MNNILKNLTVEHTVDDFAEATTRVDYKVEDLASYVEIATDVFYWINIESIWGKLGFQWDVFNERGHFGNTKYDFTELPRVPDAWRVKSMRSMFSNTPQVTTIYDNDWENLTDIGDLYSYKDSPIKCTLYLQSANNLTKIGGKYVNYRIYGDLSKILWSSDYTMLSMDKDNYKLWNIQPFSVFDVRDAYNTDYFNSFIRIAPDDEYPEKISTSDIIQEPPLTTDNIASMFEEPLYEGSDYKVEKYIPILMQTKADQELTVNLFRYNQQYMPLLACTFNNGQKVTLQGDDTEGKTPVPINCLRLGSTSLSTSDNDVVATSSIISVLALCDLTYKYIYYEPFKYVGETVIESPSQIDYDFNPFINPQSRVKEYNGNERFFEGNTLKYDKELIDNPLVIDYSLDWVKNHKGHNFNNKCSINLSNAVTCASFKEAYSRITDTTSDDTLLLVTLKCVAVDYYFGNLAANEATYGVPVYKTGIKVLNYDNTDFNSGDYLNLLMAGTVNLQDYKIKVTEGARTEDNTSSKTVIILDKNTTIPVPDTNNSQIGLYLADSTSKAKFVKHSFDKPVVVNVYDFSKRNVNSVRLFMDYSEFESLNEFYDYYTLNIDGVYSNVNRSFYYSEDADLSDIPFKTLDFKVPLHFVVDYCNNPDYSNIYEYVTKMRTSYFPVLLPLNKIAYINPSNINLSREKKYYLTNVEGKHSSDAEGVATFCSLFKIPETPPAKDTYILTLNSEQYQYFTEEQRTMLKEQCGYKIVEIVS